MQRRTQFKLILTIGAALIGIAVVEIVLRVMPIATHYRVLIPNLRVTTYPSPPHIIGISGPSRYTTNEIGMRGGPWPDDSRRSYRILAIGGSTTQDVYLDDTEAWTAVLEKELPQTVDARAIWIGNVGKSGLSARDHAVQVPRLLAQHSPVDAILVLAGANDLLYALSAGPFYRQPAPITEAAAQQVQTLRAFEVVPRRLVEPGDMKGMAWYRRTGVWQGLRLARNRLRTRLKAPGLSQDSSGAIYEKWRAHRRGASRLIPQPPNLGPALEEYERNLVSIIQSAAAAKVRLIFLTQPMIWRAEMSEPEQQRLWLGGVGDFMSEPGHAYYTTGALESTLTQYNDRLKSVSARFGVECFDLAARVPRDTLMYYDDAHYTEAGAREVAAAVASYLKSSFPRTGPGDPPSTMIGQAGVPGGRGR